MPSAIIFEVASTPPLEEGNSSGFNISAWLEASFHVPEVSCRALAKEVLVTLKVATPVVLLTVLTLALAACGGRRLNVMYTPQQTLMTIGYSGDRSQSIFRADNEA